VALRIAGFKSLDPSQICYYKSGDGVWYLYLPGCGLGNLAGHMVEEHEDGTISVQPSILVDGHKDGQPVQKHGYLARGEWRDC
jgi:hypothetical protein